MTTARSSHSAPDRYDALARLLHWGMALCFLWIFTSAITHNLFEKSAMDSFFWPTHKPTGLLLMVLVLIRILWTLVTLRQRPASVSVMAKLGHLGLYALMFAIPALGLLRQYGSGRSFEAFGIQVMQGFQGPRIQWAVDLGNTFHSTLGWILLAAIVGHIVIAISHAAGGHPEILRRMR